MVKPRLFAPGPVEVPPQVLEAMARPMVHHRTREFREIFLEVRERLAEVACLPGDDVLILAGSGTAALEAGLLAAVPKGAKVLAINAGKFGERWVKLAQAFAYEVVELKLDWGRAVKPDEVLELLERHPDAAAVLATHSETSTGVLHDLEATTKAVKAQREEVLVLADCVTSLGVTELRPKDWDLDGMFSGSQKGLMCPPGLAFAWLSERAWSSQNLNSSFYFDLRKERKNQREGQTAYTPAVSLVWALQVALGLIFEEGLEARWQEKEKLNRAVLGAGEALGCRRFAERVSPAVAALLAPEGIRAPDIVKGFAAKGMRIAGGQDHAKDVLFRPSLMGYADHYDALSVAAALEEVLLELGLVPRKGEAVAAAMRVLVP